MKHGRYQGNYSRSYVDLCRPPPCCFPFLDRRWRLSQQSISTDTDRRIDNRVYKRLHDRFHPSPASTASLNSVVQWEVRLILTSKLEVWQIKCDLGIRDSHCDADWHGHGEVDTPLPRSLLAKLETYLELGELPFSDALRRTFGAVHRQ